MWAAVTELSEPRSQLQLEQMCIVWLFYFVRSDGEEALRIMPSKKPSAKQPMKALFFEAIDFGSFWFSLTFFGGCQASSKANSEATGRKWMLSGQVHELPGCLKARICRVTTVCDFFRWSKDPRCEGELGPRCAPELSGGLGLIFSVEMETTL